MNGERAKKEETGKKKGKKKSERVAGTFRMVWASTSARRVDYTTGRQTLVHPKTKKMNDVVRFLLIYGIISIVISVIICVTIFTTDKNNASLSHHHHACFFTPLTLEASRRQSVFIFEGRKIKIKIQQKK